MVEHPVLIRASSPPVQSPSQDSLATKSCPSKRDAPGGNPHVPMCEKERAWEEKQYLIANVLLGHLPGSPQVPPCTP